MAHFWALRDCPHSQPLVNCLLTGWLCLGPRDNSRVTKVAQPKTTAGAAAGTPWLTAGDLLLAKCWFPAHWNPSQPPRNGCLGRQNHETPVPAEAQALTGGRPVGPQLSCLQIRSRRKQAQDRQMLTFYVLFAAWAHEPRFHWQFTSVGGQTVANSKLQKAGQKENSPPAMP